MSDVSRIIANLQATQPERNKHLREHRARTIRTRRLPATDTRGTRATASYAGRVVTLPWSYADDWDENLRAVACIVLEKCIDLDGHPSATVADTYTDTDAGANWRVIPTHA